MHQLFVHFRTDVWRTIACSGRISLYLKGTWDHALRRRSPLLP
jgi:hypothetical protein